MNEVQLAFSFEDKCEDPIVQLMSAEEIYQSIDAETLSRFGEDNRVEFKVCGVHLQELSEYYSMFSNTSPAGGVILIGVNNAGEPTGCKALPPDKLNKLDNFHLQFVPGAAPTSKRLACRVNGEPDFFLAVYVPYMNKLIENNRGEAFIRYGSSIHKMSAEEKQDFRASRNQIQFELEPCNFKWPDDFDQDIIQSFCSRFVNREGIARRSVEELLELKRLGVRTKTGFAPNKALALLASKDPRRIFPGCRIRVQRFRGTEEGQGATYNPITDRFIEGNVVQLIQRASALIDNVIYDFTWLNDDGKFVNTKEYPLEAWFEALVNAVVHRSYIFSGADITVKLFDDRMEIESPGGFCPPVTQENIYDVRASRNPFLMDALYLLDYVKMAREGTRRMKESMRALGLPEPAFRQEAVHGLLVRVVLRNNSKYRQRAGATDVVTAIGSQLWANLDERSKKVLELVVRNGSINVSEAQQAMGCSWPAAKTHLLNMVKRGELAHVHNASDRDTRAHFVLNNRA